MFFSIIMALAAAFLFGSATPITKQLLDNLNPFQLAGLLYLGSGICMIPFLIKPKQKVQIIPRDKKNKYQLLGAILFGGLLGPLLLLTGLKIASAASVSMWLNLELAATAILGVMLFKEHLGLSGWLALAGTLSAAMLLSVGEGSAGVQAGLFVAAACLCWGIDNHLTALIDNLSAQATTFAKGISAGTINLIIGSFISFSFPSIYLLLMTLIIGAISYGVSILLYIKSTHGIGATRAQIIFSCAPFFGVLASVLFLGEAFSTIQGISVLILAGSLGLLFLDKHGHEHFHHRIKHMHWHRHNDSHHDHTHNNPVPWFGHSHYHEHENLRHSHLHFPDIHHRHNH